MRRLSPLAVLLLVLVLAACGSTSSKPYTAAATKACLVNQGFTGVTTDAGKVGFIAAFAANGGLQGRSKTGNVLTIAFTDSVGSVSGIETGLPPECAREPPPAHERHHGVAGQRGTRVDDLADLGRALRRRGLPPLLGKARQAFAARISRMAEYGTMRVKSGLAEMLKGGVIMDVVDAGQAKIAEASGAVAVMALERVPADIRRDGGVARMSDPEMIREIQEAVSIPVMAKCRIGHFAEAQILQALEIDYIDESEVLTPADLEHHVDKWKYTVPFVCGATNLGEALRRIGEGAAMIRTKGEAGTGDIVNAVTHMRSVFGHIRKLTTLAEEELYSEAKNLQAPYELVRWVAENGKLPVVTFTAGGIATPADAALCMQLGADGVFVGSGIFKSGDPERRAKAIVEATTHFQDAEILARVSAGLGEPMVGISTASLDPSELLETRGW